MADNGTKITGKQAEAAALVAADDLTDDAIAAQVGIGKRTLERWKLDPDFLDAVAEHVKRVQAAMLKLDIAKRHKRLAVLDDLHTKSLAVLEDRAKVYAEAPGGATGLIVADIKAVGAGPSAQLVDVYAADTALMREIRAIHEQAAKELGQWTEKIEQTGTNTVQLIGVAAEDV